MSEAENELARFNGGQLFIKEYPPKVATINTIKFHMGRLHSNGFNPDLIIIDYGDLMRSRRGYDQKRFELESIFEDLRALSMEMKLPVWTATQSNREGFNDVIVVSDGKHNVKVENATFIELPTPDRGNRLSSILLSK